MQSPLYSRFTTRVGSEGNSERSLAALWWRRGNHWRQPASYLISPASITCTKFLTAIASRCVLSLFTPNALSIQKPRVLHLELEQDRIFVSGIPWEQTSTPALVLRQGSGFGQTLPQVLRRPKRNLDSSPPSVLWGSSPIAFHLCFKRAHTKALPMGPAYTLLRAWARPGRCGRVAEWVCFL